MWIMVALIEALSFWAWGQNESPTTKAVETAVGLNAAWAWFVVPILLLMTTVLVVSWLGKKS